MQHIQSVLTHRAEKLNPQTKSQPDWWGHIWRGLVYEPTGKHYLLMGRAVWLYIYLIVHAHRRTGVLYRKTKTISTDMGISLRTVQRWLTILRKKGYIRTVSNGRALTITITKWRPITKR